MWKALCMRQIRKNASDCSTAQHFAKKNAWNCSWHFRLYEGGQTLCSRQIVWMSQQTMGLCLEHLILYEPISGVLQNHTVTGYETWVQHFTLETKIYSTIENTWLPSNEETQNYKWDSHRRTLLQDAGQTERSCWDEEAGMVKLSLVMMWNLTQPGWPTSILTV